jgi:cyanophycinase-like exopeptidase
MLATAPAGVTVVGVDEDTALLNIAGRWQVSGRQSVTVFGADGAGAHYQAGDNVALAAT